MLEDLAINPGRFTGWVTNEGRLVLQLEVRHVTLTEETGDRAGAGQNLRGVGSTAAAGVVGELEPGIQGTAEDRERGQVQRRGDVPVGDVGEPARLLHGSGQRVEWWWQRGGGGIKPCPEGGGRDCVTVSGFCKERGNPRTGFGRRMEGKLAGEMEFAELQRAGEEG